MQLVYKFKPDTSGTSPRTRFLLFERPTKELRQWTVADAQGLDTTVAVYNLKGGMDWNKDLFKIPYGRIAISERQ
ncbi:MAG: hypothetical protein V7703_22570 [Hyphomicrobiales bacterium]